MKRRLFVIITLLGCGGLFVLGQVKLAAHQPKAKLDVSNGVMAFLGGLRSIAAEVVWFRADRLQEEGRFVELVQLSNLLSHLDPYTPEVWSYAAWNLAYNVSVMMPTPEDRWRWVYAGICLLRDEALTVNPRSCELFRELALMFEIKLGTDLDSAAATYRKEWRRMIEDVRARDAWAELKMDVAKMKEIEARTGFSDWTDPQLSAIYWALQGGCQDILAQAAVLYRRRHN